MANKKITQLAAQTAAATTNSDVGVIVAAAGPTTNKILVSELKKLFAGTTEYPILSGGDIAAKQITLAGTPLVPTGVLLDVISSSAQVYAVDFTVTGNILSWAGLGLDGFLVAGQQFRLWYVA